MQDRDREQQFESSLEAPVSEHAAIWEQSKLVPVVTSECRLSLVYLLCDGQQW